MQNVKMIILALFLSTAAVAATPTVAAAAPTLVTPYNGATDQEFEIQAHASAWDSYYGCPSTSNACAWMPQVDDLIKNIESACLNWTANGCTELPGWFNPATYEAHWSFLGLDCYRELKQTMNYADTYWTVRAADTVCV